MFEALPFGGEAIDVGRVLEAQRVATHVFRGEGIDDDHEHVGLFVTDLARLAAAEEDAQGDPGEPSENRRGSHEM